MIVKIKFGFFIVFVCFYIYYVVVEIVVLGRYIVGVNCNVIYNLLINVEGLCCIFNIIYKCVIWMVRVWILMVVKVYIVKEEIGLLCFSVYNWYLLCLNFFLFRWVILFRFKYYIW